jgi:hypothetical protein
MKLLATEIVNNKAVVTIHGDFNDRVRDLRKFALAAISDTKVALNTETMRGYKNVTTFTYSIAGKESI